MQLTIHFERPLSSLTGRKRPIAVISAVGNIAGMEVEGLFSIYYDWVEKRWGTLVAWIATLLLFGLFAGAVVGLVLWLGR